MTTIQLASRARIANLSFAAIDIDLTASEVLPTEIRLFTRGVNETSKGPFIFDDKAAASVLSCAKLQRVDFMIDLEHRSLDPELKSYDPDARGWCRGLEVRNGELWAIGVTWTPDGIDRLTTKKQRYISPAFNRDSEDRVMEIVNIALTAMPATFGTPALVAATRRHGKMKTLKDRKNELLARIAEGKRIAKLADDGAPEGEPKTGKFGAIKQAAADAISALEAIDTSSSDVDAAMEAVEAAKVAVDAFEDAVAAMQGTPPDADAPKPEPTPAAVDPEKKDPEQMARKDAEIVTLRAQLAKRDHEERVATLAREMDERRGLVAELVKLGRETPATAWTDSAATMPAEPHASMPIAMLRKRVAEFGGTKVALGGPRAPSSHDVEIGHVSISEEEIVYLRARHGQLVAGGAKLRSFDDTLSNYGKKKAQQLAGAKDRSDVSLIASLSRPVTRESLGYAQRAGLISLASTPVQSIEEFGASSQIALQSFRLEYNLALASIPGGWAETIGSLLPDGSMRTTFPLNFDATQYTEKTAQNAAAVQPLNYDISVNQREFYAAKEIELRRLTKGDFAYVLSWAQLAANLARARIFLRDELVTTILELGTASYWGYSATMTTGIDGQPFFSATHKIHPADSSKKLRGVATYSNYQVSATPINAANLTAEKNYATQVAAPDGRELGIQFDGILYPSLLQETIWNLIKVQDLIAVEAAISTRASTTIKNPHFMSGLEMIRGQQLAGTGVTADYYLFSREAIARGLTPWVIAEDPTEEVRLFDETSDFYKTTGKIKYESHLFLNAALLHPHAIRFVKGA